MEYAARIFARKVLLIHVALFIVVVALVLFAARETFDSARAQALHQASLSQELLATQTSAAIRDYYAALFDDLEMLNAAQEDRDKTAPMASQQQRRIDQMRRNGVPPMSADLLSVMLWYQLRDRVSHFVSFEPLPAAAGLRPGGTMRLDQREAGYILSNPAAAAWLQSVDKPQLSPVMKLTVIAQSAPRAEPNRQDQPNRPGRQPQARGNNRNPGDPAHEGPDAPRSEAAPRRGDEPPPRQGADRGPPPEDSPRPATEPADADAATQPSTRPTEERVNLLGVKVPGPGRLLVAVVPVSSLRERFLDRVDHARAGVTAFILDDNSRVIAASSRELDGLNAQSPDDPALEALGRKYSDLPAGQTTAVGEQMQMAAAVIQPSLVTSMPLNVENQHWRIFVSSRLADVDALVAGVFKKAVLWGVFVIIAMTGILVSTALTLIRTRVRLERERHQILGRELAQARQIQLAWLPAPRGRDRGVDIVAVNHPASLISGDFYDWFDLPDGRTVVTIGDVTGHGMSAAFLMATTQLLLRNTMQQLQDAGKCLTEVNRHLCERMFNGQFVTVSILVIDADRRAAAVASAGHYAPILVSSAASASVPMEPQIVLGVEKGASFHSQRFSLPPGAGLLLYTDGVIDTAADDGSRFSAERLSQSMSAPFDDAASIADAVVSAVNLFRKGRELVDDLTLVAIHLDPCPERAQRVEGPAPGPLP